MNDRACLMRALSAEQFAAWELHLYLDTHPGDRAAKRLYEQHQARADELRKQFESKYGPLSPKDGEGVEWLSSPWPWERGV